MHNKNPQYTTSFLEQSENLLNRGFGEKFVISHGDA